MQGLRIRKQQVSREVERGVEGWVCTPKASELELTKVMRGNMETACMKAVILPAGTASNPVICALTLLACPLLHCVALTL